MLQTKRLNIVPLAKRHLESTRLMRNDPSTWHWLTSVDPIYEDTQDNWFKQLQYDKTRMYLAIEDSNKSIISITSSTLTHTNYTWKDPNFIGILRSDEWDRTNRSVRIGVDIAPEYRGNGYGKEALWAFIEYLFDQQNIHRIWLLVCDENKAAIKLYKRLGFKVEGKQREALFRDGKYWNYIMMGFLEGE